MQWGVVIVRGGKVVDEQYFLIHPEPEYYNYRCTMVHGLTEEDTEGADIFPKVWAKGGSAHRGVAAGGA